MLVPQLLITADVSECCPRSEGSLQIVQYAVVLLCVVLITMT